MAVGLQELAVSPVAQLDRRCADGGLSVGSSPETDQVERARLEPGELLVDPEDAPRIALEAN